MKSNVFRLFRLMSVLLLVLLADAAAGAEAPNSTALSLIITYHAAPANRMSLRQEMQKDGLRRFQHWQDEGILESYRILVNRYVDSDNWDAMALLTFPNPAAMGRWKNVEKTNPAGLSPKALALTTAIHTAPVDMVRSKSIAAATGSSVFVVIPYKTLVSASDYLTYADNYVVPQFDGWMHEGVLSQYDFYASSLPAGRPWSTMVILAYKNEEALAARNAVVAKVRNRLKDLPAWKAISDDKKNVRDEKQVVIADQLTLP